MKPGNRFPLVQRITGKFLVLFFCLGLLLQLSSVVQAAPTNFAILVDTSGSMVGLYKNREPKPTLVSELVQSLITETTRKGDRLVVIPFDKEVHNEPGEFVVANPLVPGKILQEVEKLSLTPRTGIGTARSAAIGAGIRALQAVEGQEKFSGGIIFVVTDTDNDTKPTGKGLADYELAKTLQQKKELRLLSNIPQGGMRLEVWQVNAAPGVAFTASGSQTAVGKARQLLQSIIPINQTPGHSPGPIVYDLEQGKIEIKPEGNWKRETDGSYSLPVTATSHYRVLHYKGKVDIAAEVAEGSRKVNGAQVAITPAEIQLAPKGTGRYTINVKNVPGAGLFSLSEVKPQVKATLSTNGQGATDGKLFGVSDPKTAARVANATWLDKVAPPITAASLPAYPVQSPPRLLQLLIAVLAVAAIAGIWKVKNPPVPKLVLYYWISGEPVSKSVGLNQRNAVELLPGAGLRAVRVDREHKVVITADAGRELLDAQQKKADQIELTQEGRIYTRLEGGELRTIHLSFDKAPVRPDSPEESDTRSGEDYYGEQQNTTPSSQSSSTNEDWGLG